METGVCLAIASWHFLRVVFFVSAALICFLANDCVLSRILSSRLYGGWRVAWHGRKEAFTKARAREYCTMRNARRNLKRVLITKIEAKRRQETRQRTGSFACFLPCPCLGGYILTGSTRVSFWTMPCFLGYERESSHWIRIVAAVSSHNVECLQRKFTNTTYRVQFAMTRSPVDTTMKINHGLLLIMHRQSWLVCSALAVSDQGDRVGLIVSAGTATCTGRAAVEQTEPC